MQTTEQGIRIMVVDDQLIFSHGLQSMLQEYSDFNVVGYALNGREAVDKLNEMKGEVDIMLMDFRMPVMNGIDAVRSIAKKYPKIKCIMLTMYDDEEHITQAFLYGAKAYLTKDDEPDNLSRIIRHVHSYGCYVTVQQLSFLTKLTPQPIEKYRNKNVELSSREKDILKLIANEHSTSEIAAILNVSQRTIANTQMTLMEKTGANNSVGLTMFAIKEGII